jgi:hypothetical protein|tara:strand:- start:302 stop:577 length:276 start_codon:yes stop_codon:yes gene_type:complete
MKEWFKKHLGWVGFGVWVAFTLIALFGRFILKIDHYDDLALIGFLIMITTQLIQDILNEKYFKKYSEKVKNGIIVFIVIITIGAFYLLIKL